VDAAARERRIGLCLDGPSLVFGCREERRRVATAWVDDERRAIDCKGAIEQRKEGGSVPLLVEHVRPEHEVEAAVDVDRPRRVPPELRRLEPRAVSRGVPSGVRQCVL
jgi:hypothetical protein